MAGTRTPNRYSRLSITLHWVTVVLLLAVYATIELRMTLANDLAQRNRLVSWHFMLGLSVFAITWLRLLARHVNPPPVIAPSPPRWQAWAANGMHWALYALMLGNPLMGWLTLSANGQPIPFWGLQLPALLPADDRLSEQLEQWHVRIGHLGYWLIGLHTLAGLGHHYLLRDNTLRRMLPRWRG